MPNPEFSLSPFERAPGYVIKANDQESGSSVNRHIDAYPPLLDMLIKTRPVIERHFQDSPVLLRVDVDPEVKDWKTLVAEVQTTLPPEEVLIRLDRLDIDMFADPELQNIDACQFVVHIGFTNNP